MPNHATVLQDGTYESDVDNKKMSRTDATSTQNTDNVQTLRYLGYNHTGVLIPFQIVLDNQTYNLVRTNCFEYLSINS